MRCLALLAFVVACSSSGHATEDSGTGGGGGGDGGHVVDASIPPADGANVGSASMTDLRFAVVGDTRPANEDDTTNYPTAIITKIWQDVEAESPRPAFAVSTGDYMFANPTGSTQMTQLNKYLAARAAFSGVQYPAMGNHECTGATASNCGTGAADGVTKNYTDFINTMLQPIGISQPYYVEHVSASDGSWTAKFVIVACNAWNPTQSSWLTSTLSEPTTYTFVVRHEGVSSMSQTPCSQSQTIINAHPLTLLIAGHTHTYTHYSSDKEIIVGNGGAPLTSGMNYGYVIIYRKSDGNLVVNPKDYMTGNSLGSFTITPSGAGA